MRARTSRFSMFGTRKLGSNPIRKYRGRFEYRWIIGKKVYQPSPKTVPSSPTVPERTKLPAPVWRRNFKSAAIRMSGHSRAGSMRGGTRDFRWNPSDLPHSWTWSLISLFPRSLRCSTEQARRGDSLPRPAPSQAAISGLRDFEISATVLCTFSGFSFSATSAWATMPITRFSPSTTGTRRI